MKLRYLMAVVLILSTAVVGLAGDWEHIANLGDLGGIDGAAERATDQTVVLFFHATWCPTCKQAMNDFVANDSDMPDDLLIVIVDYDTNRELRRNYGITYQHTFVLIDSDGQPVTVWNGGGYDQLLKETGQT